MQRLVISTHFMGTAAEPSGQPPRTDPSARSVSITVEGGEAIGQASYANHVTFASQSTFDETGTISVGDGELDVETVGEGTLGPSADPDWLQGAVVWRVTAGRGRFEGAAGTITSNFLLSPSTGQVDDRQTAVLFVP
jgi:hypothetical protein